MFERHIQLMGGKGSVERRMRSWESNLEGVVCEGVEWINLPQNELMRK